MQCRRRVGGINFPSLQRASQSATSLRRDRAGEQNEVSCMKGAGFQMDVRCERCNAEYSLEESRITEAGVSVKCSRCGNIFMVRRKAVVVTEPWPPLEGRPAAQESVAGEKAGGERGQQWRVRQANGNLITFRELTTLQKWIAERKLSRDDEI